jgi:hypothetical protein
MKAIDTKAADARMGKSPAPGKSTRAVHFADRRTIPSSARPSRTQVRTPVARAGARVHVDVVVGARARSPGTPYLLTTSQRAKMGAHAPEREAGCAAAVRA